MPCNLWVEDHEDEAYALGISVKSYEPGDVWKLRIDNPEWKERCP